LKIQCVLLGLALFSWPVFARNSTDIIVMKNGDRLTGEIKGLDAGVLYVSMSYILGTSSIDWSQVAHLESKQLFIVKTENGSAYIGMLKTIDSEGDRPAKIEILSPPDKQTAIEPEQLVNIIETSDEFWRRFNGAVNFGSTYTKGNTTTQYTAGAQVEYLRERWSAGATWNSNLSTSSGVSASTRNEITLTGRHLLSWNNYFFGGLGDFLQSSVQGIPLQTTVGAGIGHYFKNTNRAMISVLGGAALQNTEYNQTTVTAPTQHLVTALLASQVKLFQFNKTNLNITAQLLPVLNEAGRVKFSLNTSYYFKITGNLSWNISFYGNWDSRPPPHFTASDYGTSSGLAWTFGLK
jgi:hypothetical protein